MTAPGPGGYRAPAAPAPVSGPAQLSARTDGGPAQAKVDLPDAKYGEGKAYTEQQAGAPLAKAPEMSAAGAPPMPAGSPGPVSSPSDPRTPFGDPSARPTEAITAGAPMGEGRNFDYAAPPGQAQVSIGQLSAALSAHFAEDETGILRLLAEDLAEMGI